MFDAIDFKKVANVPTTGLKEKKFTFHELYNEIFNPEMCGNMCQDDQEVNSNYA